MYYSCMNLREDRQKILKSLAYSGAFVATMWAVYFVMWFFSIDKVLLANIPMYPRGLVGILTSPWVHDDMVHLLSNSGPLFLFGAAMLYFYPKSVFKAAAGIWLLSGFWVWLMAHPGAHIGASGIVYGFGAFLFFSGLFKRDVRSIAVAIVIAFYYGGMVWGVLPLKNGVSWESHLFGALAGAAMAWGYRKVDVQPRKRYAWEDEPENDPNDQNAVWNYHHNWPGSNTIYIPGDQNPKDPVSDQ
jgi:membrane associated rhomboid family serine protease